MNWLKQLISGRKLYGELSEEIREHLEEKIEELVACGVSRKEAAAAARREFGNVTLIAEDSHKVWRWPSVEEFLTDVRYGLRMLGKNPSFTAIAILTLALGIGANTAIFSVVNVVLLQRLPYPDADGLVMVWEKVRLPFYEKDQNEPAPGNFADWQTQNSVFEAMSAIQDRSFNLTGGSEPARVEGEAVSANLFSLLQVNAALGRVFTADEDVPGRAHVVVMGHGLWVSRFGADPEIVNKKILLDGVSYTVVGVMPRDFLFPDPANFHLSGPEDQLWVPLALDPSQLANHGSHNLNVIARLKSRVTLAQAQTQMDGVARHLADEYPQSNTGVGVNLVSLHDQIVGNVRTALLVLLGAVGFVLLMVCANVANLLMARASARRREIAVRVALGAHRMRILRQLLTENMLLAFLGGGLGLLLAFWSMKALQAISPHDLPLFGDIGVNGRVLAFTLAISLLAALLFGIVPALAATRSNLRDSLKEGARESPAGSGLSVRHLLIVAETALGVVVLVGGGLLLRSFLALERVPLGFQPEGLLTFRVIPRGEKYTQLSQRAAYYQLALDKIGTLPGVQHAAAISFLPLTLYRASKGFRIDGRPAALPGALPMADYDIVSPGYFETMAIPLIAGRDVSWSDTPGTQQVVVINQSMARTYWPNEDPLGKRINEGSPDEHTPWLQVVGVIGDLREFDVASRPRPTMYFSVSQFEGNGLLRDWVVRSAGNPVSVSSEVRDAIWSIDKDLPISRMRTMSQVRSASVAAQAFNVLLLGLFAGLALTLATVGLYGVTAYSVAQRTREIGIRVALGAQHQDVLSLVLRQGTTLALGGVTIGVVAALGLTRLMTGLLYGVPANDPLTFAGVAILLLLVALAASYVPARRAMRVDPMVALRYE